MIRRIVFMAFTVVLACEALGESARITLDQGHPWRPPFGLDRVGAPYEVLVEIDDPAPGVTYQLREMRDETTLFESKIPVPGTNPCVRRFKLHAGVNEVALIATNDGGSGLAVARKAVNALTFECAAEVSADPNANPVDLGAILPPADWLLLGPSQMVVVKMAALTRDPDVKSIHLTASFGSDTSHQVEEEIALERGTRVDASVRMPFPLGDATADTLTIRAVTSDGKVLYTRAVKTMLVREAPKWPVFGATQTKLRYDAPISVRKEDGSFGEMNYANAWDAALQDVVVSFPNGARFVFWRGSSYVPFWAGKFNAGLSYEWAETTPPKDGFTDCVEPLMDKELRYGRVEIVESTPARVHVQWTYQSCDFKYKVWGDAAQEDFVFYPDGFGTRTLTLQSALDADYELSEFIILTPAATYPLNVLPENPVDMLFPDGEKRTFKIPFDAAAQGELMKPRGAPFMFRVRQHKDDKLAAIYFHPTETKMPHGFFGPFFDQGEMVTPCYWGSHWPLARGQTTGGEINDRVALSPCHNSLMTWARVRPEPLRTAHFDAPDTLGRSGPRLLQVWTWLVGASDADDARLVQWANSFGHPPSVEAAGATLEAESYRLERRALRLVVARNDVALTLTPNPVCVNPAFELRNATAKLDKVCVDGTAVDASEFAYDGSTLWLNRTIAKTTAIQLTFGK